MPGIYQCLEFTFPPAFPPFAPVKYFFKVIPVWHGWGEHLMVERPSPAYKSRMPNSEPRKAVRKKPVLSPYQKQIRFFTRVGMIFAFLLAGALFWLLNQTSFSRL